MALNSIWEKLALLIENKYKIIYHEKHVKIRKQTFKQNICVVLKFASSCPWLFTPLTFYASNNNYNNTTT